MATRHPIEYAKILYKLTEGLSGDDLTKAINQFSLYLQKECAMKKAPYIIAEFEKIAKEKEGISEIEITVAKEPTKKMVSTIEDAFGDKVESTLIVDESIVGGVIVKKKNIILDGSIKSQIQLLQSELL